MPGRSEAVQAFEQRFYMSDDFDEIKLAHLDALLLHTQRIIVK